MRCTTTAKVVETELSYEDMRLALHAALANAGLAPEPEDSEDEDRQYVEEELAQLIRIANEFPAGAILERDFEEIRARVSV